MLEKLDVDGMSEEEEDVRRVDNVDVNVFKVKKCAWRAPAITDYLKYVDNMGAHQAVASKHARPNPRFRTDEEGTRPAPKGLPVKMYNARWLDKQRVEMEVSEENFELLDVVLHEETTT